MAILNGEDYRNTINRLIGDGATDEQLADLENLNDTYNALENQAATKLGEVKTIDEYRALDNAWREKYRSRFFDGEETPPEPPKKESHETTIKIDDLFIFND